MIQLLGYNFFGDKDSANPVPTNLGAVDNIQLQNGIFDHFNLTKDTTDDSSQIPTQWVKGMLINAPFDGTLAGGSLESLAGDVTGYKVKRRKIGEFDWITIAYVQISSLDELTFTLTDHLASTMTDYEYAFVPMYGNVEGTYVVQSVKSQFNGVFIADQDNIFKLDAGVEFDTMQTNQKLGIFEPFGRKYPVVISNGNVSYQSGALTGTVLNEDYDPTKPLNRKAIVAQRKLFVDFLNNRRPKIVKDWNSQAWLIMVTNNPTVNYAQGSAGGLANVTFGWTEVGDIEDRQDLYANGLIPTAD